MIRCLPCQSTENVLWKEKVKKKKSLQAINAGEGVKKREPSYTVGGNANQYSHYGEQCGDSLKNWKLNCLMTQQQLELDMEQQSGSKQEKEYLKAVYCHPTYLTSMKST